ncbi:hypothetical protein ALC57_10802 [Trachymyrmex cornetzi]|uniref:Uncharacterized protein n=1 Tax=Trachymyrmex cornetzi TaxID=471704 RepID=A0A151J3G4_9HYME|nr:hypothetical protein ALC57_10802 [Trachymyrmex cornetzi]
MYSFLKNVHTSYPPARSYRKLLAEKIYLYPKQAYETTTNSLQPPTTHSKMRRWFRQLKRTRVAYTTFSDPNEHSPTAHDALFRVAPGGATMVAAMPFQARRNRD